MHHDDLKHWTHVAQDAISQVKALESERDALAAQVVGLREALRNIAAVTSQLGPDRPSAQYMAESANRIAGDALGFESSPDEASFVAKARAAALEVEQSDVFQRARRNFLESSKRVAEWREKAELLDLALNTPEICCEIALRLSGRFTWAEMPRDQALAALRAAKEKQ